MNQRIQISFPPWAITSNACRRLQQLSILTAGGPSLNPVLDSTLNSLGGSDGGAMGLLASLEVDIVLLEARFQLASEHPVDSQGRCSFHRVAGEIANFRQRGWNNGGKRTASLSPFLGDGFLALEVGCDGRKFVGGAILSLEVVFLC